MSFTPIRTAAPSGYPITRTEVKAQLQIDDADTSWDTLLDNFISAATSYVDGWSGILGRCLLTQTYEVRFECFEGEFDLPFPDVSAVVVKYYDTAGTLQTYSSAYYQVVQETCGAEVSIYPTSPYPAVSIVREDPVVITVTAGYGTASDVPAAIKQGMLMLIGHWFSNREAVSEGQFTELPLGVKAMFAPFRRLGLG